MSTWYQKGIRLFKGRNSLPSSSPKGHKPPTLPSAKGHKPAPTLPSAKGHKSSPSPSTDDEDEGSSVNLPAFPPEELKSATQNYCDSNLLAEGEWGKMHKGRLAKGCLVAVKSFVAKSAFEIEKHMLSHLQHTNIIRLFGYCIDEKQYRLVYELMENRSLNLFLFNHEHNFKLDWKKRMKICLGVARAIHYLHEESGYNIVHRDIKASNVLLDKNFKPKLADFSTARPIEEWLGSCSDECISSDYTRMMGTGGYMAPEVMNGYLTSKVDVYSFGILVIEIASGTSIKDLDFDVETKVRKLKGKGNLLDMLDPTLGKGYSVKEAQQLLNLSIICTDSDPSKRPDMSLVISVLEGKDKLSDSHVQEQYIGGKDKILDSTVQKQYVGGNDNLVPSRSTSPRLSFDRSFPGQEEKLGFEVDFVDPLSGDLEKLIDALSIPCGPSESDIGDNSPVTSKMYKPFEELKALILSMEVRETLFLETRVKLQHLCEGLQSSDLPMEEMSILDQIKSFLDGIPELSSAEKMQDDQSRYLDKYESVKQKVESTKTEAKNLQSRASALRASIANISERTELILLEITKLQHDLDDLSKRKIEEENELGEIAKTVASRIREVPPLARWLTTEFNQRQKAKNKLNQAIKCLDDGKAEWNSIQKRFQKL